MNWREAKVRHTNKLYKGSKVYLNDDNLKPDWVKHPAENTEFHIVRSCDEILVVIGESWTYGETLPNIATGVQQYSLESQIQNCFGPKLALMLNSDLYQYAVPGNCNFYMISSIDRILQHITTNFNYKKIRLCVQLTEPGREMPILNKLTSEYRGIWDMSGISTFQEWLTRYDEIMLDVLETTVSKFNNIEVLVWKNFCSFEHSKTYSNFKIVNQSWIQFSGEYLGINLDMQKFQSVGWFDDFYNQYKHQLIFDKNLINLELDKIEASNKFISSGNKLHNNHPSELGHDTWAFKLYNEYTK